MTPELLTPLAPWDCANPTCQQTGIPADIHACGRCGTTKPATDALLTAARTKNAKKGGMGKKIALGLVGTLVLLFILGSLLPDPEPAPKAKKARTPAAKADPPPPAPAPPAAPKNPIKALEADVKKNAKQAIDGKDAKVTGVTCPQKACVIEVKAGDDSLLRGKRELREWIGDITYQVMKDTKAGSAAIVISANLLDAAGNESVGEVVTSLFARKTWGKVNWKGMEDNVQYENLDDLADAWVWLAQVDDDLF